VEDKDAGEEIGVRATPTFIIDGKIHEGLAALEVIRERVE